MRRSAIAALVLGGVSVTGLLGCAQYRGSFSQVFGQLPGFPSEPLPPDSIAGRVQAIEELAENADSLPPAEVAQAVESLAVSVQTNTPAAIRLASVRALGRVSSPASFEVLRSLIGDQDPELRAEVCRSLGQMKTRESVDLLTQLAQHDPDVDVKLQAVRSLGRFSTPQTVQALNNVLDDRDPAVQYVAMESLETVTGEDFGPDVRKWKEFASNPERVMASRAGASVPR